MDREKEAIVAGHDEEERGGGAKRQGEQSLLGVKARRGIPTAKRSGLCTPAPAWKLEENVGEAGPSRSHDSASAAVEASHKQHLRRRAPVPLPVTATGGGTAVSARKLGADLWGNQDISRMSRRGARGRHHREEHLGDLSDLSPLGHHGLTHLAGDSRKHVAASMTQHRKSTDGNARALQPVSPVSYHSSVEVAACNQAITPTSSLDHKGRSGYSLKTSMELLRVLNRIWSLEEQHASSMSLVKTLKSELEHAQRRIQELLQEKQSDRHEIDVLMNQIMEDKLVRKSKEQERIKAAVQSVRDELEDERKLRRRSESLHRKLAKELSEVKSAFLKTLKDHERENKTHNLLEDLCDEFAKGVREYEQEVRELKQKSEKGCDLTCDRFVLHISEAWLDERLQMKLAEARGDLSEKKTILDRLTCEIETFLKARRMNSSNDVLVQETIKHSCLRRHSLESVQLNGAVSAPQDAEDEDSVASDLHCFELNMHANMIERHDNFKLNGVGSVENIEARKSNVMKKMIGSSERFRYQSSAVSQVKFNEHVESCNGGEVQFMTGVRRTHQRNISEGGKDASHVDAVVPQKSEDDEFVEDVHRREVQQNSTHGSNNMFENSVSEMEFNQVCGARPTNDLKDDSCAASSWRHSSLAVGRHSASGDQNSVSCPVQQRSYHNRSPDLEISSCSSKLSQGVKENSLKAKLLEARLEGRHARLKTSRGSSVNV